MITSIRPKVLFKAIEEHFPNQNTSFTVNIPSPDIGGTTLLESSILISLLKLCHAKKIFEFGTYMGCTTLLLAQNSPEDAKVTTLDIPTEEWRSTSSLNELIYLNGDANDDFLRTQFVTQGARCIQRAQPEVQKKVTQILKNSLHLDAEKDGLSNQFDLIFIDGGHQYSIVQHDTQNAYQMAKPDAVLIWHDYASNIHADVTHFLNTHAQGRQIFHVANTMIAFELLGNFAKLLEE
jgi:predicted O-methyltransferase YrrM